MGQNMNLYHFFWFYCAGVPQFYQKMGPPSAIVPTLVGKLVPGVLFSHF